MVNNPLNPFESSYPGRYDLAQVLLSIREQAGCSNWRQFEEEALRDAWIVLNESNMEVLAPTPRFGRVPSAGVFYAIEVWNRVRLENEKFRFPNGEAITAIALLEVLYQRRHPSGELVD